MKRCMAAGAAVLAVLALPSAASARTYTAYAGQPGFEHPAGTPEGTELNAFFPRKMKVRQGDSVKYLNHSFHTVSILGRLNSARPPLAEPEPSAPYTGVLDPQGNPFFFNGRARFVYNPDVFGPVGDTNVNDRDPHSSGAFFPSGGQGQPPQPGEYTLKFSRKGRYEILCLIHPGMQQDVRVLKRKAKGADKAGAVRKKVAKQSAKLFKEAGKAAQQEPGAAEVSAGRESKQATLLKFAPESVTVPVNGVVSFVNRSPSEPHNMVFIGPKVGEKGTAQDYVDQHVAATEPQGPGFPGGQVAPGFIYGSEEPGADGIFEYSGDDYGNGFFWSPLMDGLVGEAPNGLPSTEKVRFTKPGTFFYFCGIHGPGMSGSVTVQ